MAVPLFVLIAAVVAPLAYAAFAWLHLFLFMRTAPTSPQSQSAASAVLPPDVLTHQHITTTIFWVGEKPDNSNGHIANTASAWDENWAAHFGGVDDPDRREGFRPAGFLPRENTFYAALPYSDLTDDGKRKLSAMKCPGYLSMASYPYSWCKNSWIAIKHGDKTAYAQWEDVGPFEDNDTAYVFGSASPKNRVGSAAGLDVSPAVRDYLGLSDVDSCNWTFVSIAEVPSGPWRQTITVAPGTRID